MQTSAGPVVVMLLPEHARAQVFSRGNQVGRIEPFGHGTLALLGADAASLDDVSARVRAAVRWQG